MSSSKYNGYLNMLAIGIYGVELTSLGTGFVSILKDHKLTIEMDWLYLLDVIKIFLITGYLILQCCWDPSITSTTFNTLMYIIIGVLSSSVIFATISLTMLDVLNNINDKDATNDYLIYIL